MTQPEKAVADLISRGLFNAQAVGRNHEFHFDE
jgi:hypothetical protein